MRVLIMVEHEGKRVSLRKLSKVTGLNYRTLRSRYRDGKRGAELTGPLKRSRWG